MSVTLYDILGVDRNASQAEIKSAYRKLALVYHPDRASNTTKDHYKFIEIKNAYEILSNPLKRYNYDEKLEMLSGNYSNDFTEETYRPPPPPHYYYRRNQSSFSRTTYIYGTLFVLGIAFIAVLFPTFLMYKSANTHFDRGLAYYEAGMYSQAIDNFTKSINDLGGKNGLANYYNSYILFYHYHNYQITIKYIDEALDDISNDSLEAELYWMKGRCYHLAGKNNVAMGYFDKVEDIGRAYDSAQFYSGIISTVINHEYEKGLWHFNETLLNNGSFKEALYFKAYCLQKLDEHWEAIRIYNNLLLEEYESGAVYFHRALSELKVDLREKACADLDSSVNRQVADAIKLKSIYCDQ